MFPRPSMLAIVITALGLVPGSWVGVAAAATPSQRHEFVELVMATRARIVIDAADEDAARAAARAAFDRMHALDGVMSDYRPTSELRRLESAASGRPVEVSRDLLDVLARADRMARLTGGAFDPTVGALSRLWREARAKERAPDRAAIVAAQGTIGFQRVRLDATAGTVALEPAVLLDLGGIGKGFAADAALAVLSDAGFPRALVDHGGDIRAGAAPTGTEGWSITAPGEPPVRVRLKDAAIATSGDTHQFIEIDGVRHSHLIDPRTGKPVTRRVLVTVIAPDGATADALASALSVLEPREGIALIETQPRIEARLVMTGDDGTVVTHASSGFNGLTN